jgi:hypothetical protein
MYEDLEHIAQLKLNKEVGSIAECTREKVKDMQNEYAARSGVTGAQSGPQISSIAQVQIDGAERMVRAMYQIWVDLIGELNGHINRQDLVFIAAKVNAYAQTQTRNLRTAFANRRLGAVVNLLSQKAEMRMHAIASDCRRDMEIMVREHEAFPTRTLPEKEHIVTRMPKKRFSPGRRVLVGNQARPGTIASVGEGPEAMGEFRHTVTLDQDGQTIPVLGCDLQAFPELDEDLPRTQPTAVHLHIENSSVANLNLGVQIRTINTALESISERGGASQQDLVDALKQLTEATITKTALPDTEKQEIVQALSTLAEQALMKPEERSKGPLRAVVSWLPTAIAAAADLTSLWEKFGPVIKAHFGI